MESKTLRLCLCVLAFVGTACGSSGNVHHADGSVTMDGGSGFDAAANPPMPCDSPGALERVACAACGTVERFCTAGRVWSYGLCESAGECAPGTFGTESCGRCGTRRTRCTTECVFESAGECEDEPEGACMPGERTRTTQGCPPGSSQDAVCDEACRFRPTDRCESDECATPGEVEEVACGLCGTRRRTCSTDLLWQYEPCMNEGVCEPGGMREVSCGACGTRQERCLASCEWDSAASCIEGECMSDAGVSDAGRVRGDGGVDACGASRENALSTVGCNGFAVGEPAPNEPDGTCTEGSCLTPNATCETPLIGPPLRCLVSCSQAETYISTGDCPTGYRCFNLGGSARCFRDCDGTHPCPTGFSCDGEGSCIRGLT